MKITKSIISVAMFVSFISDASEQPQTCPANANIDCSGLAQQQNLQLAKSFLKNLKNIEPLKGFIQKLGKSKLPLLNLPLIYPNQRSWPEEIQVPYHDLVRVGRPYAWGFDGTGRLFITVTFIEKQSKKIYQSTLYIKDLQRPNEWFIAGANVKASADDFNFIANLITEKAKVLKDKKNNRNRVFHLSRYLFADQNVIASRKDQDI